MRLLICGDRNWKDKELIKDAIESTSPTVVIHGGASGADRLADEIAKELGIKTMEFPAQWNTYGKAAGPIRNKRMLEIGKPDLVIAFHDDIEKSKGTKDMLRQTRLANVKWLLIDHHRNLADRPTERTQDSDSWNTGSNPVPPTEH